MCFKRCQQALALVVGLFVLCLISFLVLLLGRCVAAASAYASNHDGDWNVAHILGSHEFWDFSEGSYWGWGGLWVLIFWVAVALIICFVWILNWAGRVLFDFYCCESVALCIDCCGPRAKAWRARKVREKYGKPSDWDMDGYDTDDGFQFKDTYSFEMMEEGDSKRSPNLERIPGGGVEYRPIAVGDSAERG